MEVPSAFYLTANCFVELTDCLGCVDFVLVILAGASASVCMSDSYPEHHRSLNHSPDGKASSSESSVHIFCIRYVTLEEINLTPFGSDIFQYSLRFLVLVATSAEYD